MSLWKDHILANQRYEHLVQRVCAPLIESLGVPFFGYSRVSKDGGLSWVNSNPEFDALYFEEQMYLAAPCACDPDLIEPGFLAFGQESMQDESFRKPYLFWRERIQVDHFVVFIRRRGDGCDFYSFSGDSTRGRIPAGSVGDLALLRSFVEYFDSECAAMMRSLGDYAVDIKALKGDAFYEKPKLPGQIEPDRRQDFLRLLGVEARFPGLFSLAPREQQVLGLLGQRLPQKTIAKELCLSLRTVEHYIVNLRTKLDLDDREDLVRAGQILVASKGW